MPEPGYEDEVIAEEDVIVENEEIIGDIQPFDPTDIVVYSRDWTIETIYSQIMGKNIDLNPKYQRRNAWTDIKRSKLMESILIGFPVPEIVLAEDPVHKKSFAVIDGKQRLLTVAGFVNPKEYSYWDKPLLNDLSVKKNLNGRPYSELKDNPDFSNDYRQFINSSLRCTIITNYKSNDILYDIFYRLNSGSVPLSTQELRQVLFRGEFANFLIAATNELQPVHQVMKLKEPDKRLRDIEIVLRIIAMVMYGKDYTGNLKTFLDNTMKVVTSDWANCKDVVVEKYEQVNSAINRLVKIFGDYGNVGRKYTNGKLEKRFNRVLLEVQVFYFSHITDEAITDKTKEDFLSLFNDLCQNPSFRASIEATTKSIENYKARFSSFETLINTAFGLDLKINPFPENA